MFKAKLILIPFDLENVNLLCIYQITLYGSEDSKVQRSQLLTE